MASTLIPYFISGGGFAGLVILLILLPNPLLYPRSYVKLLLEKITEKDAIIATERARADLAVKVADAGKDALVAAIRGGANAVEAVASSDPAGPR